LGSDVDTTPEPQPTRRKAGLLSGR